MLWIRTMVMLGAAAVLAGCADDATGPRHPGRIDRHFTWRGPLDPGQRIDIRGINGSIRLERASGPEVVVDATTYGDAALAAEVRVKVVRHPDGITVCARYPDHDGRLTPCIPDDQTWGDVEARNVRVEFTVEVPDGVTSHATTINGAVTADLDGDTFASSVNGNIDIVTGGIADAHTVNGSIDASVGAVDWHRPLRFVTVNGSLRIAIRRGADVRVTGTTVNGRVATDFPLSVTNNRFSRSIRGSLGAGTWTLTMTTVNGDVDLREYR